MLTLEQVVRRVSQPPKDEPRRIAPAVNHGPDPETLTTADDASASNRIESQEPIHTQPEVPYQSQVQEAFQRPLADSQDYEPIQRLQLRTEEFLDRPIELLTVEDIKAFFEME